MFRRRKTGFWDFLATALTLWAALYHTPVGALGRDTFAALQGVRSSARPLLTYYSGGVYDAQEPSLPSHPPPSIPVLMRPASGQSMAYGVFSVWSSLTSAEQAPALTAAAARGIDARKLSDHAHGPQEMSQLLASLVSDLGSEDAAVLALFAGEEPARYAAGRARASGEEPTLEALSRILPPGSREELGRASRAMALGTAYGLDWPVTERAPITSPFGWRVHPLTGRRQLHTGVDLGVPLGTDVHVVAAGRVRRASEDGINGKVLVIDHGHGVTTAYCHNSQLEAEVGQEVGRGAAISRSGSTGRSTGPHLHYQLELGHQPVDPLLFRPASSNLESLRVPPRAGEFAEGFDPP